MLAEQKERNRRALERKEIQLKSGVKTKKKTFDQTEPLSEKDTERLTKEIETLKKRI